LEILQRSFENNQSGVALNTRRNQRGGSVARGGYRPGAGRPKKAATAVPAGRKPPVPADIRRQAKRLRVSPLEYMLAVLNDDQAMPERRDRMAIAAAPFVHAKPLTKGAPAEQVQPGQPADDGWGNDLRSN
jgi:hypothetical protein